MDVPSLFLTIALPLLVLAWMLRQWWKRGRDPDPRSVSIRYEPPGELTPGEVGALLRGVVTTRHITATLVDLAARGHLGIEERSPAAEAGGGKDYLFRRLTDPAAWGDLCRHERTLLHTLFTDPRERPDLSDLERRALALVSDEGDRDEVRLTEIRGLQARLGREAGHFERILEQGYYVKRPDLQRGAYVGVATVVFFLGMWMGSLTWLLSAAAIGVVGWLMPARTEKGARAAEKGLGFKRFLEQVESARLEELVDGPEDFERTLAYALALGVEREWASAFSPLYEMPDEGTVDGETPEVGDALRLALEVSRPSYEPPAWTKPWSKFFRGWDAKARAAVDPETGRPGILEEVVESLRPLPEAGGTMEDEGGG